MNDSALPTAVQSLGGLLLMWLVLSACSGGGGGSTAPSTDPQIEDGAPDHDISPHQADPRRPSSEYPWTVGELGTASIIIIEENQIVVDQGPDVAEPPGCSTYGSPEAIGVVDSSRVNEASGLAVSSRNPGLIWTHNDSGGDAELFGLSLDGHLLTVVHLAGAQAYDWEDLAIGPCPGGECLYVGDIGNNSLDRDDLALYRLAEPSIDQGHPPETLEVTDWQRFAIRYPGESYDAESLMVDRLGRVYLLTKASYGRSVLFRFPELAGDQPLVLGEVGEISVGNNIASLATAADLDRSSTRLVVRTYLGALEWRFLANDSMESIVGVEGVEVPVHFEIQGEAIAYEPDGLGYLHLREGLNPVIYRVRCLP